MSLKAIVAAKILRAAPVPSVLSAAVTDALDNVRMAIAHLQPHDVHGKVEERVPARGINAAVDQMAHGHS